MKSKYFPPREYSTQQWLMNDIPTKYAWWLHMGLMNNVDLYGLDKDVGKVCDLYSDTKEYEVMHNCNSWSQQNEFPFAMQYVHNRKNPDIYTRPNYESYYVQFRDDWGYAHMCNADHFVKTMNGYEAVANFGETIKINPFAKKLGNSLYNLLDWLFKNEYNYQCT